MLNYLVVFLTCFLIIQNDVSLSVEERMIHFNIKKELAIQGYDPVAYFKNDKAIKGTSAKALKYKGIVYYFSTDENKQTFSDSLNTFEPEYGGWCAYAMGDNGKKVSVNPKTFKVVNGKLYLFYNKFGINTLEDWNKDEEVLLKNADHFWLKILNK